MKEDLTISIPFCKLPLHQALSMNLTESQCHVYKITVGGKNYIGFTSQNPELRLEQHIESAKKGSKQKIHSALRRFGYLNEFEIVSSHPNEILALVAEIAAIEKLKPELNVSIGGEGNYFNIVDELNEDGEKILVVINKSEELKQQEESAITLFQEKKNTHEYLFELGKRLIVRYQLIDSMHDAEFVEYANERLPNHLNQKTLFELLISTVSDSDRNLTRPYLTKFYNHLRYRANRLYSGKNTEYEIWHLFKKLELTYLEPNYSDADYLDDLRHTRVYSLNDRFFRKSHFPSAERIIYIGHKSEVDTKFNNASEARSYIKKLLWFRECESLGAFKKGDAFYPVWIKDGTYRTGFLNLTVKQSARPIAISY